MSKQWIKWHRLLALLALVPLFIMSVTGAILVFKPELDAWLLSGKATLPAPAEVGQRQSMTSLMTHIKQQLPAYELGSWELFDDGVRSDAVYLVHRDSQEWAKVFLDPYRGVLLSEPVGLSDYLSDWLVDLHYRFLLGPSGTIVGFLASLALLFLGISGLKMHRQFYRKLFSLRWRGDWRVRNSSLHRLAGAWAAPVLIILAFTGGYWNAEELLHDLHEVTEPHPPLKGPLYTEAVNFDELLKRAQVALPGIRLNFLVFPTEPELDITFYGKLPGVNPLASNYSASVNFSPQTGELTTKTEQSSQPWYLTVDDSFRALHFGDFAGMGSRIVWTVLGSMPLILGISGLYLYLSRRRKKGLPASI
ncbi:PepSY domain-containing protein [Shewanella sp. JM162201]|uniref:PepSY domain-containing protein n=1 Tax=Shewanella jiangmenensis TaxID=2837387 RepID=A0ABS5UZP6_9GAMM|nr:PepSY-associated TM helix domain-containing protein [Shewanella jiangmenensis]MBT1443682.1 PepSY domain-containing protein [Shewanella jiangmenensis]